MNMRRFFCTNLLLAATTLLATDKKFRPVPLMQVVPLPKHEIAFHRAGQEIARYHYAPDLRRPFIFPIVGPSGRWLTRMGHPHDPESHSHHNSFWVSHHDVNGVSFWDDRSKGRIVHRRIERLEDGDESASITTVSDWVVTNAVLLTEWRKMTVIPLANSEWWLLLDLHLEAKNGDVKLGKTPFGMVGVRMAKTIGVNDGGGTIRNSEGGMDEAGVLWKPARWVDYSGRTGRDMIDGLTLMDHPQNPNHPTVFHVRNDGWMGASLTFAGERVIARGESLRLRYGLYVHSGVPSNEQLDRRWREFTDLQLPDRK